MKYILGCNYWASNAGAEMWSDFDPDAIDADLSLLSDYGISYLRVFPNWRDFQPIVPMIKYCGNIDEYAAKNSNRYYLDFTMLERFSTFLDICDRYGIRVIVALITGWMSGGMFIPSALYDKNLITDPIAQYFEQMFIKGFVAEFKNRDTIYAWDLGNECNCMGATLSRYEAASWSAMISNAIKSQDSTRPIVSGMHSLTVDGNWRIQDQGEFTDVLTTHPYPYWCEFTRTAETLSKRTTIHPTAQGKYYSDLGHRPCLAEEIGTMGPMLCSNERAASFLRINLFSLWANGSVGTMWWCASDQTMLNTFPYTHDMVEQELGMFDKQRAPKPVLFEMKKFADFLEESKIDLPRAKTDAVCILTKDIRHWGVAYMTYMLTKEAGLNIDFAYCEEELPDSSFYLMPSINGVAVLPKDKYAKLKEKVYAGATLYVSIDNGILSEFEEFTGLRVIDSSEHRQAYTATLCDKKLCFSKIRNIRLEAVDAKVLLHDDEGGILVAENSYGKGKVIFVNAPIESSLIDSATPDLTNFAWIYRHFVATHAPKKSISIDNSNLFYTLHDTDDGSIYLVITNHNETKESFTVKADGYSLSKIYYGNADYALPYDACVMLFKKV